ncbi:inorganic phosphate transporter [Melghirimyces algeriensis]|nr:inorganic phosphate transporter [Melghirimyces algeriensis]
MMLICVSFLIASFFAMNIGAGGAAATMGVAYGAGAVRSRKVALWISGVGVFLGATLGGDEVAKTISGEIIPDSMLTPHLAVIILASACTSLFIANRLGLPLSTSEVTVGSVVGAGIALHNVFWSNLVLIVALWILIPVTACGLAWITGRVIAVMKPRFEHFHWWKGKRWLPILLVLTGFLEAVSAGMNNVANAVGPLVGTGMISLSQGILFGGFFVALGSILLGGRVLETNGKRITHLSMVEGCAISGIGAFLVIGASLMGIPLPLTQVTSSAIIGTGMAREGFSWKQKLVIEQMLKVWLVSPLFSLVITYGLVKGGMKDFYSMVAVISVFLATWGSISLMQSVQKEKRSLHEDGGGI